MQASCAFVQEKSSAFFDHALSAAESSLIVEHLSLCEDCASLYAKLEKLQIEPPKYRTEEIETFEDPDYWSEMDRVLDAEIDRSMQNKTRSFDYSHVILAALVLLCVGWGLYQQSRAQALSIVVDSQQQELERLHNIYMQVPADVPNPYIPPQGTTQQVRYDL